MWPNPKEISSWAYYQCSKNKSTVLKSLITTSKWAYLFCKNVQDDPEVRKYITNPYYAFLYLIEINYDRNLRNIVKNTKFDDWYLHKKKEDCV